jgi:hypothetical protein
VLQISIGKCIKNIAKMAFTIFFSLHKNSTTPDYSHYDYEVDDTITNKQTNK